MTQSLPSGGKNDFVDAFVEEAIRHPERAEEIKQALRDRLSGGARPRPRLKAVQEVPDQAEAEDLWDNVPI